MSKGVELNLDPGVKVYLERVAALAAGVPPAADIEARRAAYVALGRAFSRPHPPGIVSRDAAVEVAGRRIPIRIYRPDVSSRPAAVVYCHGGGWVIGDLESHDSIAADICGFTDAVVVAVHYRRAPEHKYPAAFEDAYVVLEHVAREAENLGIDRARIAVAGDSAGGNLAAAVALKARDAGSPRLVAQLLFYPVLGNDLELASYRQNANSPTLTRDAMREYWAAYVAGGHANADCCAAPLLANSLGGLPHAIITTAEYDPVRDDGRLYADRLAASGVTVTYRNARRLPHGWLRARSLSEDAREEFELACRELKMRLTVA